MEFRDSIDKILMDFAFKRISREEAEKAIQSLDTEIPYSVLDLMLHKPLAFVSVNEEITEDIEEQPDMFDPELSTFYNDGNEAVKIIRNKQGTKDYIFDTESSDYIDSLITDPADTSYIVNVLAQAFNDNDDFANILKNANRNDNIVFNTSKNGKIKISMDELFNNAKFLERQARFEN